MDRSFWNMLIYDMTIDIQLKHKSNEERKTLEYEA